LASAEKPPEFISLHPAALTRYRLQVERLADSLRAHTAHGELEPAAALRELVESVIVAETAPDEPLRIEVRGKLAALLGHDVFPQARVGGKGGSGGTLPPIHPK